MENTQKPLPAGQSDKQTLFTIVVWYSHKLTGQPYSYAEKKANKNRFFHPSFDFVISDKGKTVTTHNEAWDKALAMLVRKRNTIICAFIETTIDGKEYHVAKVTKGAFLIYAKPVYGIGKNLNDVIIRRWDGNPLEKKSRRVAA